MPASAKASARSTSVPDDHELPAPPMSSQNSSRSFSRVDGMNDCSLPTQIAHCQKDPASSDDVLTARREKSQEGADDCRTMELAAMRIAARILQVKFKYDTFIYQYIS